MNIHEKNISQKIVIDGKKYHSLDEVSDDVRKMLEEQGFGKQDDLSAHELEQLKSQEGVFTPQKSLFQMMLLFGIIAVVGLLKYLGIL